MNNLSVENYVRPKLELPNGGKKLLLHSCCAPCAGEIMEAIAASNIETTIYFYNPNIHPREEYEIRKDENITFADTFATTLGISRWKDLEQINASGLKAANRYNDLDFWDFNWRKQGGSARMLEISKQEKFYKQEYCGCVYSLRDTNRWRKSQGREIIKRGINFYEIKP